MEQRDHLVVYNTLLSELLTCELFQITEILVYTLSNLFDSTNLIKLIWLCINGFRAIPKRLTALYSLFGSSIYAATYRTSNPKLEK